MKAKWLISVFILIGAALPASAQVGTVPYVDLTRYVGKWYEIAGIPQSFSKQCVANTTAEYTVLNDGKIQVVNGCDKQDGTRSVSEGRAKVVDLETNAKLKVTFVKLIDWVFGFGGDYWILGLNTNYRYAVVGHPTRDYGWILARDPYLSTSTLRNLERLLKSQGYDTCKLLMTPQEGGQGSKTPLCQYVR